MDFFAFPFFPRDGLSTPSPALLTHLIPDWHPPPCAEEDAAGGDEGHPPLEPEAWILELSSAPGLSVGWEVFPSAEDARLRREY